MEIKLGGAWEDPCQGQRPLGCGIPTAIPQGKGLQSRDWCLSPTQGAPPFLGGGLEQLRLLRDRPPPQLRSHQDQELQRDQPPGTAWKREGPHEGSSSGRRPFHRPGALGRVLEVPQGHVMPGKGMLWSSPVLLTWAGPQVAEATLLVSSQDVRAPVPTGPRGTVCP